MPGDRYPLHHHHEVDVNAGAERLFAYMDDHRRLAGHMEKPSLMMAGASMRVETDALQGQAIGSVMRISGRVLGMDVMVDEVVTERVPPFRKTWETRGEPRLLVIGSYRMGFTISPQGDRSRLVVLIDYQLPPTRPRAWCGPAIRQVLRSLVHPANGHRARHPLFSAACRARSVYDRFVI